LNDPVGFLVSSLRKRLERPIELARVFALCIGVAPSPKLTGLVEGLTGRSSRYFQTPGRLAARLSAVTFFVKLA
jgi:hypothetical protein